VSNRIGKGPWARALGAALVPDGSAAAALRGEELWRSGAVHDLRIAVGQISARVEECGVTVTAPTIRPRIWEAVTSTARTHGPLARAVRGELQSAQLEHVLTQDWEDPLIPPELVATCRCDGVGRCEHVAAVAYAVVARVDAEPAVLLRWRVAAHDDAVVGEDAWRGAAEPPTPPELRGRPESVLKRLGPSGLRAGGGDVADVLTKAYEALRSPRSS